MTFWHYDLRLFRSAAEAYAKSNGNTFAVAKMTNGLIMQANGKLYYYQSGEYKVDYTGLVKHTNGKLYYVKSGVFTSYNGTLTYDGLNYKVVNGVAV